MKIRRGDSVVIIAGNDAASTPRRVISVLEGGRKLVVEGANRVFKHVRRGHPRSPQGGRLNLEMPIDSSNVMFYCASCNKGTRVGFRYRDEHLGMDLVVDSAELELAPFALLARRVVVRRADLAGVRLELFDGRPATEPRAPSPRDPWEAPIDLALTDIRLARGEFRPADGTPVLIHSAQLSGSWIGARIEATRLVVDTEDGQLELAARIGERAPRLEQLAGKFRWRAGAHLWQGRLEARGAREHLDLSAHLDTPVRLDASGNLRMQFEGNALSAWQARLSVPRFRGAPLFETEAFDTLSAPTLEYRYVAPGQ